jgi:hypothetical protein
MIRAAWLLVAAALIQPSLAAAGGSPWGPHPGPSRPGYQQRVAGWWDQGPSERQERPRRDAERGQGLSPEPGQAADDKYQRWQRLSPEQRQSIRQRYERFRSLSPDEQAAIRRQYDWYRQQPPETRRALRDRWQQRAAPEQQHQQREGNRRGDGNGRNGRGRGH